MERSGVEGNKRKKHRHNTQIDGRTSSDDEHLLGGSHRRSIHRSNAPYPCQEDSFCLNPNVPCRCQMPKLVQEQRRVNDAEEYDAAHGPHETVNLILPEDDEATGYQQARMKSNGDAENTASVNRAYCHPEERLSNEPHRERCLCGLQVLGLGHEY